MSKPAGKDWLWKLQMTALESRAIGSDACRLLLLLCKRHHRNLCSHFPEPFKLSLADAATMLGYSRQSDHTLKSIVTELINAKYLIKTGVTGSPPTTSYIISDYRQPAAIKHRQPAVNEHGQPAAINSSQPAANLISTSFQEEIKTNGSNSSHEEFNGSLRSEGTKGIVESASPNTTKGLALGDAQRQTLSQLKASLLKPTVANTVAIHAKSHGGQKQLLRRKNELR